MKKVSDLFMVIAIDGGAASGKSSTSRLVAERLQFLHIDTGSHYRALTCAFLSSGHSMDDPGARSQFLEGLRLETRVEGIRGELILDGCCYGGEELRSDAVNAAVSLMSSFPEVREALRSYQQNQMHFARESGFAGLVMEGRDIGTVIFPDAPIKIFLEADEETRAQRRMKEGQKDSIAERDKRDRSRKTAPLKPAEDAIRIDNSQLSLEDVVEQVVGLVEREIEDGRSKMEDRR